MEDKEELQLKLEQYRTEHAALDGHIARCVSGEAPTNLIQVQMLKKKKLWLKDMIEKLESDLIDDIIA